MQSSQSVLQSDFLKGLPCFVSLAVHVVKSAVYLIIENVIILNTRQKSFHSGRDSETSMLFKGCCY